MANCLKTGDANDLVYALEASADHDPNPGLEKIQAPLLALNTADDLINPPELGILEREIKRVPRGRALVLPLSRDHAVDGGATCSPGRFSRSGRPQRVGEQRAPLFGGFVFPLKVGFNCMSSAQSRNPRPRQPHPGRLVAGRAGEAAGRKREVTLGLARGFVYRAVSFPGSRTARKTVGLLTPTVQGEARPLSGCPGDEVVLRDAVRTYRKVFAKLGLLPPFALAVSHVNVSGFSMYQSPTAGGFEDAKIYDQQLLIIPEQIIETDDDDAIDAALRLILTTFGTPLACSDRPASTWQENGSPGADLDPSGNVQPQSRFDIRLGHRLLLGLAGRGHAANCWVSRFPSRSVA
ncbi:MAG TPA: hypothetical protein VG734_12415 [Lacunisphaera sp.]|nr:hypothetical protein [Lacunisphaera sp.]